MPSAPKRSSLPLALILHAGFVQLVTHSVRPTISYRALELGIDQAWLGVIAAAFSIVPVLFAVPIGRAADRGHIPSAFAFGAAAQFAAVAGLLLWSDSIVTLAFWGLLLGTGHVYGIVAQQSLVSQAPTGRLDRAFGVYTFYGTIGQVGAPMMLVLLGGQGRLLDTQAVFIGSMVGAVVVAALVPFLLHGLRSRRGSLLPTGDIPVTPPDVTSAFAVPADRRRRLIASVVVSMSLLALVDVVAVYLPAWGVSASVAAAGVGLLLTLRATGMLVGRLFVPWFVTRIGRGPLQVWSAIISGLGAAALFLPIGVELAAAAILVSGLAVGVGQPVGMSYVSATAPPGTRSTWLAVRLSGNGAGQLVVPPIAGAFAALLGAGGVILLTACAVCVASGGAARALGIIPRRQGEADG